MEHWSDDFSLYEAMGIANLMDYEPEPDVHEKADYILGLTCHLIEHPPLATGHDAARHFLARARGAVWRK